MRRTHPPTGAAATNRGRHLTLALVVLCVIAGMVNLLTREGSMLHAGSEVVALALLAVAAISWLRHPVSLLPPLEPAEALRPRRQAEARHRIEQVSLWLSHVRWVAIVLGGFLTLAVANHTEWLAIESTRVILLALSGLTILNLVLAVARDRSGAGLLRLQIGTDLVALTMVVHATGGIENRLAVMMVAHVTLSGIVLSRRECYLVGCFAFTLYAAMALGEWSGVLPHYQMPLLHRESVGIGHVEREGALAASYIALQATVLLATAYIVTTVVTRMRLYEERLDEATERAVTEHRLLEQALAATGTGLCVLSADGTSAPIEMRNQLWNDLVSGAGAARDEGPPAHVAELAARVKGGEPLPQTLVAESSGGNERSVQLTAAPLEPGSPRPSSRVVVLAQDVTEARAVQEQLLRAGRLAAVGELVANVAHEVNNPNGIISAKARLLLSDRSQEMSPVVAEEIGKIVTLSDRVAAVASGLLSSSRPPSPERERVEVRVPIERAIALVEGRARAAAVRIRTDALDGHPPVLASAADLEQVFLNLLLNALDAMPRGGDVAISVDGAVPMRGGGRGLAIHVQDSGPGIVPDLLDRVFEPFVTTKEAGRGTGLGLSISRGLIRAHGGCIDLKSELGQGTRFTICLPLALPQGTPDTAS